MIQKVQHHLKCFEVVGQHREFGVELEQRLDWRQPKRWRGGRERCVCSFGALLRAVVCLIVFLEALFYVKIIVVERTG
jgi:hypothetical protein